MAHHALGRTHRNAIKQLTDRLPFGCIIKYCRRTVCVDVIDFAGRDMRTLERSLHGLSRSDPGRIRLRNVKVICGNPVAYDLVEDGHTTLSSELEIFQRENSGAFAQHHAGTISIKGATF